MSGPSAVGGPSRVPQQPTPTPVAEQAPPESNLEDAITAMHTATARPARSRIPRYARDVARAFRQAEGSPSMAQTLLSDEQITGMAGRSRGQLARDFQLAGLSEGDASTMAGRISERLGAEIRDDVVTRGHELIAERRAQLTTARDAITALRDAPEGTPIAAVYDALVERFGEEKIAQLMEHFDAGLEALDEWDGRLDNPGWTLGELSDAARQFAPPGSLRHGTIASDEVARGAPISNAVGVLQEAGETVHLAFEVAAFLVEIGHSASAAAASGAGAVFGAAAIGAHHVAHHYHEEFIHGMQRLFEEAQ